MAVSLTDQYGISVSNAYIQYPGQCRNVSKPDPYWVFVRASSYCERRDSAFESPPQNCHKLRIPTAAAPMHKRGKKVHKCTNKTAQMLKCTNKTAQMLRCTNKTAQSSNAQTKPWKTAQMLKCTNKTMETCRNAQMHKQKLHRQTTKCTISLCQRTAVSPICDRDSW